MIKEILIPKYQGNNPTHNSTSWYLLPSNDISDLSAAIHKSEDDADNIDNYVLPMTLPSFELAYVYVVRNMSDGSKMEFPVKQITSADMIIEFITELDIAVDTPTVNINSNTLSNAGNLEFTVSDIKPSLHIQKSIIAIIKNEMDIPIFNKRYDSSDTTITIFHDELSEYTVGELLTLTVIQISTRNIPSRPHHLEIFDLDKKVTITSKISDIDFHNKYAVTLSANDIDINGIDVYHKGELVQTSDDNIIFNSNDFKYDARYDIYVNCTYDNKSLRLHYIISTQTDRSVYPYNYDSVFNNVKVVEQVVNNFHSTYIEQGYGNRLIDFDGNDYYIYESLNTEIKNIKRLGIQVDNTKDVIIRVKDTRYLEIFYVDLNDGKRYSILATYIRSGVIDKVVDKRELPADSAKIPIYILDTENADMFNLLTVIKVGDDHILTELTNDNDLTKVVGVVDVNTLTLTHTTGERISILGNMDTYYLYDYNNGNLDNICGVSNNHMLKEWIPTRSMNGNPIYFSKNDSIAIQFDFQVGRMIEYSLGIECKGVVSYRDGSYTILTIDPGIVTVPNINDFYRFT